MPATGYWVLFRAFGGMATAGLHVHVMQALGWLMILIYMHLYFAPYRRLREAVITENWPEGGKQLNQIRKIVGINLLLGLVTSAVGAAGRYL